MEKNSYTIGSDPEVFVANKEGKVESIIGLLSGTKEEPLDIGRNCSVQEDNILAEFNIPPVTTLAEFLDHINYCKEYIETIIAAKGLQLHYASSEKVRKKILNNKQAKTFGCSPSYNVLKEEISTVAVEELTDEQKLIRSSGFHIHIGHDNPEDDELNDKIVLCFELFVTIPLMVMDNDEYNRRLLYGLIGDSRTKPYGVECRSLGGYFLKDDETITIVWERVQEALKFCEESPFSASELRNFLNTCVKEDGTIDFKVFENVQKFLNIKELKLTT